MNHCHYQNLIQFITLQKIKHCKPKIIIFVHNNNNKYIKNWSR
jgi:hypothetical protein